MRVVLPVLLFALSLGPASAQELSVGSGFWPLLSDAAAADEGRVTSLIRRAYATVGVNVVRLEMPWARILSELTVPAGSIGAGYPFGKTKEREALYLFSDPVGAATRYIWYNTNRPFQWDTVEDLKGLRIGVVRGAVFGPVHEALRARLAQDPGFATVEEVANELANMQKLAAGRVDVVFCEEHQAEVAIAQLSPVDQRRIKAAARPIMDRALLYVLFRKDSRGQELRDALNRGLRNLAYKLD